LLEADQSSFWNCTFTTLRRISVHLCGSSSRSPGRLELFLRRRSGGRPGLEICR
jgi:hypothetical protein